MNHLILNNTNRLNYYCHKIEQFTVQLQDLIIIIYRCKNLYIHPVNKVSNNHKYIQY